jgi:hypothetical protein
VRLFAPEGLPLSGRSDLRAPTGDGAVLAAPPLEEAGALLSANRERARRRGRRPLGRPWPELQRAARHAALEAAGAYLRPEGVSLSASDPDHLIVAGHQPDLFHPGVWVKNFALDGLARRHGGCALNLVVDNDTLKSPTVRVPAPAGAGNPWPHLVRIPFDAWGGEVPVEERPVLDRSLLASFADRAGAVLAPWGYEPLLRSFWPEVRRRAGQGDAPLLGECFASGRRALERQWGCRNLEVPLSAVCRTEPFAWFVADILADLTRFHRLYNSIVAAYRQRRGIRSRNHPVPDLGEEDGWLEIPFWGWRAGQARPRRRRLFARRSEGHIELRAGSEPWPDLPAGSVAAAWHGLEAQGFKARTRALTTTLYARLFLADLFLHGIGGGKYDELTDELIAHFYEADPPEFIILSATRLLPLPAFPVRPADRSSVAHELRDTQYNPQRYVGHADVPVDDLLRARQAWEEQRPADRAGRREGFRRLRALTAAVRLPLAGREEELRRRLDRIDHELAANAVLRRRDYAFCLYPAEALRPFCTQFL